MRGKIISSTCSLKIEYQYIGYIPFCACGRSRVNDMCMKRIPIAEKRRRLSPFMSPTVNIRHAYPRSDGDRLSPYCDEKQEGTMILLSSHS